MGIWCACAYVKQLFLSKTGQNGCCTNKIIVMIYSASFKCLTIEKSYADIKCNIDRIHNNNTKEKIKYLTAQFFRWFKNR